MLSWIIILGLSVIANIAGWSRYFKEQRRRVISEDEIAKRNKDVETWQHCAQVWQESAQVWKKASITWKEAAETHERSSEAWRTLYLEQKEEPNLDSEEFNSEEFIN